jgi:hypothetical protein
MRPTTMGRSNSKGSSKNISIRDEPQEPNRISNGPNIYVHQVYSRFKWKFKLACFFWQQIGAEIGRGGFAIVFQAFNVETGDFVAVKRFPLKAIDDDSLSSIEVILFLFYLSWFYNDWAVWNWADAKTESSKHCQVYWHNQNQRLPPYCSWVRIFVLWFHSKLCFQFQVYGKWFIVKCDQKVWVIFRVFDGHLCDASSSRSQIFTRTRSFAQRY